ncbi:hypothetical protein DMC64_18770 [Amycolatopsis sp. WAC 04197]|uniref:hypothetical protein n=1 Tax=Amycolatopsis sp. WAC 04197 TaxID=2203199 RepID=UPI000F7A860A|nr:hypothetical protein [Amycolatopsis sp. WAC 04197]RSN44927.1 hypothetical protein DMC64_18770 [Amycolatopsis sp. WAC 04197]
MSFAPTEAMMAYLQKLQAEGKLIVPADLVRMVKTGPGTVSLGEAQRAGALQAQEQQGIEADTLAAVARLENAWTGQGGDAARAGLRPLAQAATEASAALHGSQNTLADQDHAFQATRDSMVEISATPPQRNVLDVASPWDTDTEVQLNERNAAIQRNNEIYNNFTRTSDGHAQAMPIQFGQIAGESDGTFSVGQAPGAVGAVEKWEIAGPGRESDGEPVGVTGRAVQADHRPDAGPGSEVEVSPEQTAGGQRPGGAPASPGRDDGTEAAGFVRPAPSGIDVPNLPGPGWGNLPAAGGGADTLNYVTGPDRPGAGPVVPPYGRTGAPGAGGPGSPGRFVGAGPLGQGNEPAGRTGAGGQTAAGSRGTGAGVVPAAARGKGKDEDTEKKSPDYLQEPDPQGLFGYTGRVPPPVIGK